MSPKTPINLKQADIELIVACFKLTAEKPDFEKVAKELGLASAKSAYKHHWDLKKKMGLTGTSGRGGRKPAAEKGNSKSEKAKVLEDKPKAKVKKQMDLSSEDDNSKENTIAPSRDARNIAGLKRGPTKHTLSPFAIRTAIGKHSYDEDAGSDDDGFVATPSKKPKLGRS